MDRIGDESERAGFGEERGLLLVDDHHPGAASIVLRVVAAGGQFSSLYPPCPRLLRFSPLLSRVLWLVDDSLSVLWSGWIWKFRKAHHIRPH